MSSLHRVAFDRIGDRTYLNLGDLVLFDGTISARNIPDFSIQGYAARCLMTADLPLDALLPGHHSIPMREGKRRVNMAVAALEQLLIPRSAILVGRRPASNRRTRSSTRLRWIYLATRCFSVEGSKMCASR